MMEARERRIIELAGKQYLLLRRIDDGVTSVVWEALDVTGLDRHPSRFELVEGSDKEVLEHLRSYAPSALVALPEDYGKLPPERRVALKVAREGKEAKLQQEARHLEKFEADSWHRPRKAQVVRVRADLTARPEVGLPILVEDWVHRVHLDKADPYDESDGFPIILQLVEMVEDIWATKNLVATDSIKPNSLIWNSELRSLFLIDWGIVGRGSADMSDKAFPLLANTIYRLFTGQTIEFDDALRANPLNLGKGATKRWERLAYGTKAIIRRALFRGFPDPDPKVLRAAARAQWDLWQKEGEQLLALASTEKGESALNAYDLAMLRGQSLSEEERERYLQELYRVIEEGTIAGKHDDVLFDLSWARLRYPQDPYLRHAWLAHRAGRSAHSEAWGLLKEGLASLQAGDHEPALEAMRQAKSLVVSREPEALILEAQIEIGLAQGERRLEGALASKLQTDFKRLSDLWVAQGWGDDEAFLDLKELISRYTERVDRIPTTQEDLVGRLEALDYEGALDKIHDLRELWPSGPDFDLWEEAIIALRDGREREVLLVVQRLSRREVPVARKLDEIAVKVYLDAGEEAALQDDYQEAIRLAKVVADHRRQDEQLQTLLGEYQGRADTYESAMAGIDRARSESPQAEIDALRKALDHGFRYDRQRQALGRRRFECQVRLAARYSEQGELDQAIMQIRGTLEGLTALGEKMDRAGIDPGVDPEAMRSQAEEMRIRWIRLQREEADTRLVRIPNVFGDTETSIDSAALDSMRVCLEILKDDPGSAEAAIGLDAMHAFQRGLSLLKERRYGDARSELGRAVEFSSAVDDPKDEPVKNRIHPYLELAEMGSRLEAIAQSPEIEFRVTSAVDAFVASGELEDQLMKWDDRDAEARIVEWLKRQRERLVEESILQTRERARQSLHDLIEDGLSTNGGLHASEPYSQAWYRETSKALEAGLARLKDLETATQADFVHAGVSHRRSIRRRDYPLSREVMLSWLEEWNRRVHALYNYDLARALVLEAAVWSGRGREDIANTHLARAAQAAKMAEEQSYTGSSPDDRQPREELLDETERYLGPVWEETYDKLAVEDYTDLVRWMRQGFEQLEELDGLKELGDLVLLPAAREQMEERLEELVTLGGEDLPQKVEAARVLARYKPTDLRRTFFHFDLLKALVHRGLYTEANELAEEVERLHKHRVASAPALSDARKRLSDEICNQLRQHWLQIVTGATVQGRLGDRLDQGLQQLDPDLSSLAAIFSWREEVEGAPDGATPSNLQDRADLKHPAARALRSYLRIQNDQKFAQAVADVALKDDEQIDKAREAFAAILAEEYEEEVNRLAWIHPFLPWRWARIRDALRARWQMGPMKELVVPKVGQVNAQMRQRFVLAGLRFTFVVLLVGVLVGGLRLGLPLLPQLGERLGGIEWPPVPATTTPTPTPTETMRTPEPSPTSDLLVEIEVDLAVGEPRLEEAGAEVWRQVIVRNVGPTAATTYLRYLSAGLTGLAPELYVGDDDLREELPPLRKDVLSSSEWALGEVLAGHEKKLLLRVFRRSISEPEPTFDLVVLTRSNGPGQAREIIRDLETVISCAESAVVTLTPVDVSDSYSSGVPITFLLSSSVGGRYRVECRYSPAGEVAQPPSQSAEPIKMEADAQVPVRCEPGSDQEGAWLIEVYPLLADDKPHPRKDDLEAQPVRSLEFQVAASAQTGETESASAADEESDISESSP